MEIEKDRTLSNGAEDWEGKKKIKEKMRKRKTERSRRNMFMEMDLTYSA